MSSHSVSDLWWKNAVVYCLDVETYADSDGDGVGDFVGLTNRIDYLAGLGVTCLWLLPFYPTPNRDDGYDVTDYYAVDERLGSLGEFVEFMRAAGERGIRVVIDLVVNHTSVDHKWFRQARSSPDSPYRDWYVWSDEPLDQPQQIIFPDKEDSNWAWDEQAGQYYLHRFYSSQPDLDVSNVEVREEIDRIMGFWLELGVSGFRVDAVPYLIGGAGIQDDLPEDPHWILREMRGFLNRRRGDAVMFGEVNLGRGDREQFFGDAGDEMTGLFDFILSGGIYAAVARGDARVLADHLRRTSAPPRTCQWLNFVRSHDELNLSRLPEDQRDDVMAAFAPEEDMRIYGRGIRRRLPPMVGGDRPKIELFYSLLFTLPGTPVLFYGEEIGMGDRLDVTGREAVRLPMQWADGTSAGFSTADPGQLTRPLVDSGPFGYQDVNVADQRRRPDSLLNWFERAIRVRKELPTLGLGEVVVMDSGDHRVLAHCVTWRGDIVVVVHNVSGDEVDVHLRVDLDEPPEAWADVFGDQEYDDLDVDDPTFRIPPYGYRWVLARTGTTRMTVP